MKKKTLSFQLPQPWDGEQTFTTEEVGYINYLVGPNGSGKSRFATQLRGSFDRSRLINTDRLSGLAQIEGLGIYGDRLNQGLGKHEFPQIKNVGVQTGFGLDAFVLLEEKMDLRVRVEATLSQLFDRQIFLEWESGFLKPKAILTTKGTSYDIKSGECHGIKEMLVLLTHLYNDENATLIIDEPEQNLHPQFQAFFMDEVRKLAGDPETQPGKKIFFLITHSPFILDLRSLDDLRSVISFDQKHSIPKRLTGTSGYEIEKLTSLLPRLRAHHKQLFFSDNPVFVEGHLDAQIIVAMQNALGLSAASAGSCVLDVGGKEEVNLYLSLCKQFDKAAYFVYDLDALFNGKLCQYAGNSPEISEFLQLLGFGKSFTSYCGGLAARLYSEAKRIRDLEGLCGEAARLQDFLLETIPKQQNQHDKANLAQARTALLIFVEKHPSATEDLLPQESLNTISGTLDQIDAALATRNIFVLRGGELENHLPSYSENPYKLTENAKSIAVEKELQLLSSDMPEADAEERYGALFRVVKKLPSKSEINMDDALKVHISRYINELQMAVKFKPSIGQPALSHNLEAAIPGIGQLLAVREFNNNGNGTFDVSVGIKEGGRPSGRFVEANEKTAAGSFDFRIVDSDKLPPEN